MDEEDILLTLGYLLLKRSIRRRKQQETNNVRKMWMRDILSNERTKVFTMRWCKKW